MSIKGEIVIPKISIRSRLLRWMRLHIRFEKFSPIELPMRFFAFPFAVISNRAVPYTLRRFFDIFLANDPLNTDLGPHPHISILIPCHSKDVKILPLCLLGAIESVENPISEIVLITNTDFISNNFYEGRLIVDEKNNNRKIIYKKGSTIQSDGIHYLEMNHEDRIQSCDEETQIVKKLMKELIGSEFIDKDNKSRKLTIEDILVISPYNAQVNYLLARLDKGAKVGTIDKFQGQEAPVTIISMTSSDAESLPRNKAFFFSRNRLNVAISRAQCVSVILFNPQLLETSPTTEEQMRLLNNFCKILQYNNSNHIF